MDQLRARLSLFNGRRLIAAAIGGESASFDEVRAAFAGDVVELLPMVNDPGRREMVAHMELLRGVSAYRGEGDCTFYGHAKGASSYLYGEPVRRWAAAMYRGLLDFWPAVQRALVNHAAVGVFRRILTAPASLLGGWHYSGTFRWLRNKDIYSRNWQVEDGWWMGSELYPGRHFTLDESACLFGEFAYGGVGLYGVSTWDAWAQASVHLWETQHVDDRQDPQLVTVILTAHAQPQRVHDAVASVQAQSDDRWQLVIMCSGVNVLSNHFDRYAGDARIQVHWTGEYDRSVVQLRGQAWAINEAWRRGLVRGDLVIHLSDDDVLASSCIASWLAIARARPGQDAWYGTATRERLHADGHVDVLGPLEHVGAGTADRSLRRHVDGLQVCTRRSAHVPWPEDAESAPEADGIWMEQLAKATPIHPAPVHVGCHRHTPESTFTR